ncbi:MAG: DUF2683 family protein [Candidatus Diapherotrites archaeon]|nr:DUF2683 family protein [Candidatus Diapherotrites archaeon]
MVDARVILAPYSNKVINVVKAKYDLPDKSAAINKFIEIYGRMEVEKEPKDELWKALAKLKSPKNALSKSQRKKVEKELEGKDASYVFRRLGLDP